MRYRSGSRFWRCGCTTRTFSFCCCGFWFSGVMISGFPVEACGVLVMGFWWFTCFGSFISIGFLFFFVIIYFF
ncbi:hypothetical protein Hanom_Chr03g00232571 [Helianthus anomalus]